MQMAGWFDEYQSQQQEMRKKAKVDFLLNAWGMIVNIPLIPYMLTPLLGNVISTRLIRIQIS